MNKRKVKNVVANTFSSASLRLLPPKTDFVSSLSCRLRHAASGIPLRSRSERGINNNNNVIVAPRGRWESGGSPFHRSSPTRRAVSPPVIRHRTTDGRKSSNRRYNIISSRRRQQCKCIFHTVHTVTRVIISNTCIARTTQ